MQIDTIKQFNEAVADFVLQPGDYEERIVSLPRNEGYWTIQRIPAEEDNFDFVKVSLWWTRDMQASGESLAFRSVGKKSRKITGKKLYDTSSASKLNCPPTKLSKDVALAFTIEPGRVVAT